MNKFKLWTRIFGYFLRMSWLVEKEFVSKNTKTMRVDSEKDFYCVLGLNGWYDEFLEFLKIRFKSLIWISNLLRIKS